MSFLSIISNFFQVHWLVLAFLAPMFWAIVNVVDVYFVKGIYKDELDGSIITALFQIIPVLVILILLKISANQVGGLTSGINGKESLLLLALVGGFLFNLAIYFYYKALFNHDDVALLQIIWSLTIVVVPILSFLLLGEELPFYKYLGMGIVLLGVVLLSLNKKLEAKFSWKYFWIMSLQESLRG